MQNAFGVFRSRTPVSTVKGDDLCHCASMAVLNIRIFDVYEPFENIYVHIRIYMHIHTYKDIYEHRRRQGHIYIHIYLHILTYIHILTLTNCSKVVFWRGGGRRPGASGWASTYQIWCDRSRDWMAVRGSCIGDLPAANGRDASGALDACSGWGAPNRVRATSAKSEKKWMPRCPGMPWVWPADCCPWRQCFGDVASFPVSWGVIAGNTCIYKHNTCIYLIYIQIHDIRTYTYIYELEGKWCNGQRRKQQYTCRYMHIRTYTCIYLFRTYIFSKYVYLSFIREYTAYTFIYVQGEKWWFGSGSQKKCTYIACILTYLHVYDSVYCMYIARIHVYCMYIAVSMRLATLRTENTSKYVYTCKYVQYTYNIHTIYIHEYVHRTTLYINRYMHVYMHVYVCIYTCMTVNRCCQHVQLLYCPKNDRLCRETQ